MSPDVFLDRVRDVTVMLPSVAAFGRLVCTLPSLEELNKVCFKAKPLGRENSVPNKAIFKTTRDLLTEDQKHRDHLFSFLKIYTYIAEGPSAEA